MIYIQSEITDPRFNLALEEYAFERLRGEDVFMLWRNAPTVVVGRHQNTFSEINADYVRRAGINVVRRITGGGAVYHDLGNLNYTFAADDNAEGGGFDFALFSHRVAEALGSLGVRAEVGGRNDMTIEGRKFSGAAQHRAGGRTLHHGTLLYCSDLEAVQAALNPSEEKLLSKGVGSVRSRVTNIAGFMPVPLPIEQFRDELARSVCGGETVLWTPDGAALSDIAERRSLRYDNWDWNYGRSPRGETTRTRRFEGVGQLTLYMTVEEGRIGNLELFGDYFGAAPSDMAARLLTGCRLDYSELFAALTDELVERCFSGLTREQLCRFIAG